MYIPTLEEVIRQHVPLPTRPNGRGFFSVLCKVCNDHGKKGKRAGFKFDNKSVGYNCFNCGHSAGFDPVKHTTMPRDMVTVLQSFGIADVDWQPVIFESALAASVPGSQPAAVEYVQLEPDPVSLPSVFYPLTDDPNDDIAQISIDYLASRKIDWQTYPFFIAQKSTNPDHTPWYGRLIIPVYKGNKLIFWQGRDLTGIRQQKYLSPPVPRDNILSGYHQLDRYTTEPLYIVEGWFDAYHLNGVAIFGGKMTPNQIKILNRCPRPKVVVPDRQGDGHILALQALDLGWAISTPDIGSCKDINAAVIQYGSLYPQMSVIQNTYQACFEDDHFEAKVALGKYCEVGSSKRKGSNKAAHHPKGTRSR